VDREIGDQAFRVPVKHDRRGTPQPLCRPLISNTDLFSYDVAGDGSRFIVNTFAKPASAPPLDIVLNATAQ
jgi:hypothetical protein